MLEDLDDILHVFCLECSEYSGSLFMMSSGNSRYAKQSKKLRQTSLCVRSGFSQSHELVLNGYTLATQGLIRIRKSYSIFLMCSAWGT